MNAAEDYQGMLEWTNRAIVALGGEPVTALSPGIPGDTRYCSGAQTFASRLPQPVVMFSTMLLVSDKGDARAVAKAWKQPSYRFTCDTSDSFHTNLGKPCGHCNQVYYAVYNPDVVERFIRHFDAGEYPELILQRDVLIPDEVFDASSSELVPFGGGECASPVTVQAQPAFSPFSVQAAGCTA